MRRIRLSAVSLLLVGLTALLLTGCWPASDNGGNAVGGSQSLRLGGWAITTLDPAQATDAGSLQAARLVFSGLMSYDRAMRLQPDLAADFPVSHGGITYTFTLRPDTHLQDGRSITAADVKYSIERACKPSGALAPAQLPCARSLGEIAGVSDVLAGRGSDISGLKVLDDFHLSIVLTAADSAFPYHLAAPVAFVVDRDQVQSDPTWTQHPNGSGPYRVQRFDEQGLLLTRNSDYYGTKPSLDYIEFGASAAPQADYEAGKLDVANVAAAPSSAEQHTSPRLRLTYWGLNTRLKPFDDPLVRQAFTRALDVDSIQPAGSVAAYGLLPPWLGGPTSASFDLSAARELLAQSSYKSAANLPPIEIFTSNNPLATVVSELLKDNLGANISVHSVEYSDLIANYATEQSFITDYTPPAAEAGTILAALLRNGSADNLTGYSNPTLDDLFSQLAVEDDDQMRARLLQQIEGAATDVPIIPLSWAAQTLLIKPYVQGATLVPWGLDFSQVKITGR